VNFGDEEKRREMKVNIEIVGVPMLSDIIRKKKFDLTFPGKTVKDLLDELIRAYGTKVGKVLYGEKGTFDPTIQISLNGEKWIRADRHDTRLKDGDTVMFMILLGGG
jgi:molybdopterin converting factor small subunit